MRRSLWVVLVALFVTLGAGTLGCDGSGKSAVLQPTNDPQALIAALLDPSDNTRSWVSPFEMELQFELDPAKLSAEDLASLGLFQAGIKASGTAKLDYKHHAIDMDMTLAMAGISYQTGVRLIQQDIWMLMLGQWYDLSPALKEGLAGGAGIWQQTDSQSIEELMTDLKVDRQSWLGEAKLVGEETLGGNRVYHLTCAPDVVQLLKDMTVLLQNEEFLDLVDPTGSLTEALDPDQDLPTAAELQEIQATAPQIFPELTLDLWVGIDNRVLRQMNFHTKIVPPADADMEGLKSITFSMTMSYNDPSSDLDIKAPESFLPYSTFQKMFGSDLPVSPLDDPGSDEPTKS